MSDDVTIPIGHADVLLHSVRLGDSPPESPNMRLYSVAAETRWARWALQIRGGLRASTPMFATAVIDREAMWTLRLAIDDALGVCSRCGSRLRPMVGCECGR